MAIKNRYALMTERGDVIAFYTSLAEARGSKKSLERGFGKRQTLSERPRKGLWIKDGETGSAVPSDQKNPRGVKLPSKWTNAKVRVDAKGNVQIGLAKDPFLGKGGALAKGVRSVKAAAKKVARKVKRKR